LALSVLIGTVLTDDGTTRLDEIVLLTNSMKSTFGDRFGIA